MIFDFFGGKEFAWSLAEKLLAGAVVAVLTLVFARGRQYLGMRKFKKIFGKGIANSDDVVLSVPLWSALPKSREEPRFAKIGPSGTELSLYGPDQMYNRQDMFAAAHVLNILNSHLDEEVTYSNDSQSPQWDQKTLILIGSPTSNFHARYYLDTHVERRPQDVFPTSTEIAATDETGARACIVDPKTGTEYRSDGKHDFGLVLRLANVFSSDPDHFVFLVAGIHEWSTREAGRLFNTRWRTIGQTTPGRRLLRLLQPGKWHKPAPPAGFIFQMSYGEEGIGTGTVLHQFQ
jgi:hypothetical protein